MEVKEAAPRYSVKSVDFQETDVGFIPVDWRYIRLTKVARLESGHTPSRRKPSYWAGDIPWVSLHDTESLDENEIARTAQTISTEGLQNSSARLLPKGTVVFSRTATVGKASIMGREMATSQDFANYICGPDVYNGYLVYLFRHMAPEWKKLMAGSIHNTVYMPVFRALKVVLPTRNEQEAIAEALSDADALIESLSLLLAKKRQIKQGAMQELLTGKKRLPGFSGQWTHHEIGDIASPSTEVNADGEALPVLACSKHFGFVDSLGFFKNQVFSRDTASYKVVRRGQIGYPANHIEEGSIGLQDLYEAALVSPIYVVFSTAPGIDSYFLHRLLKLDQYRQTFSSATSASVDRRGSLRWPEFSKINVVLPLYEEQCAVRQVLRELEAEIAVVEAKLDKARLVKQGMSQELLTGRIRLVQPASKVMRLPTKSPSTKPPSTQSTHNWQINEAVVIGVLVQRFGSEKFPLPRKRRVKLMYLLHRHAEGRAEGYLKKAAGPYDPNTKYKGPEQIALKNGYVRELRNEKYEGFVAGDKIEEAQRYFEQWYGAAALGWLERFHYRKTDELELLATVGMAMVDLAANGEPANVTRVKRVIAAHPEWLPKLSRELFSDERIAAAIAECQTLFGG